MLDMGFQPQVDKIVRRLPSNRQTMFFSATLDGEVGELARAYTNSPSRFEAELSTTGSRARSSITSSRSPPTQRSRRSSSTSDRRARPSSSSAPSAAPTGSCRSSPRHGVRAVAMHGDMSQGARERALARFESGKVETLVATDVAARGLDLDDITHVINFDPPEEDKGYVHRTGRTGRAGRSGTAVTFVLPEQQAETSRVARRLGHREQFEQAGMRVRSREARLHEPSRAPLQVVAAAF